MGKSFFSDPKYIRSKVPNESCSCGFPDGPDCVSLGQGANGLEQFADDGCCLLPFRCGNGDGGERCERVSVASNPAATPTTGNIDNSNDSSGNTGNTEDDVFDGAENFIGDNDGTSTDPNCGFPNGPDCISLGTGDSGLEQFADDGCCLLPFRCGNGDGGERCERVPAGTQNNKARVRRQSGAFMLRRVKI